MVLSHLLDSSPEGFLLFCGISYKLLAVDLDDVDCLFWAEAGFFSSEQELTMLICKSSSIRSLVAAAMFEVNIFSYFVLNMIKY